MLDRLLESKSKRVRSPVGPIVSVTAHSAFIAAALYATAQAHVAPPSKTETMSPVYFPPAVRVNANLSRPASIPRPAFHIVLPTVSTVPVALPPIDLAGVLSRPTDFPIAAGGGGNPRAALASGGESAGTVLTAEQVEKQAAVAPGNTAPRYPEVLRSAGVEGRVTAMFVVNELGRAEDSTVRFAQSDNALFEESVRTALRRMRFIPAEVGGRKVRQLVQMPFVFTISK